MYVGKYSLITERSHVNIYLDFSQFEPYSSLHCLDSPWGPILPSTLETKVTQIGSREAVHLLFLGWQERVSTLLKPPHSPAPTRPDHLGDASGEGVHERKNVGKRKGKVKKIRNRANEGKEKSDGRRRAVVRQAKD